MAPILSEIGDVINPNRSVLVDSNVVISAFDEKDSNHEISHYFLDESEYYCVLSMSVIVETWGMLVGSRKKISSGIDFIRWLSTPGRVSIVSDYRDFGDVVSVIGANRVDCVDAILMCLATKVTNDLKLRPAFRIATYDMKDFLRVFGSKETRFSLYDLANFEEIDA